MPAKSKAQYRYMQGIAHGMKPRGEGPSQAQAAEYVADQGNYKSLPKRVPNVRRRRG